MIICTLLCLLQTDYKEKSFGSVAVSRLYVSTEGDSGECVMEGE